MSMDLNKLRARRTAHDTRRIMRDVDPEQLESPGSRLSIGVEEVILRQGETVCLDPMGELVGYQGVTPSERHSYLWTQRFIRGTTVDQGPPKPREGLSDERKGPSLGSAPASGPPGDKLLPQAVTRLSELLATRLTIEGEVFSVGELIEAVRDAMGDDDGDFLG